MRTVVRFLGMCALVAAQLPFGSRAVFAQQQTISASGDPGLLRISVAVPGSEPIPVSNSTTTYTVSTGNPNKLYDITAQLNAAMPVGLTLNATFDAPASATSLGPIPLDPTPRSVVTGIPRRTNSTHSITYQLVASVQAGVVPVSTRTVTLTVIETP